MFAAIVVVAVLMLVLSGGGDNAVVQTAQAQQQTEQQAPEAETEQGSLRVCNQTQNPVSIALGYRAERGWQSEGWWVAAPAECKAVYSGDLDARRYYYLYAADDIGGGSWDGDVFMCTRDETFTIFGVEDCLARGYERTGFFEIDTQNRSNWTLQLTSGQPQAVESDDGDPDAPLSDAGLVDPDGDMPDDDFENPEDMPE